MARYNEILAGRFNRFLQKHFSMKGESPAPQLASEIATSIQILSGVENDLYQGWDRFGISVAAPGAGAGNSNGVRLRNPATSNAILVIEWASAWNGGANDSFILQLGITNADLQALATSGNQMDGRGRAQSIGIVSNQTTLNVPFLASLTSMGALNTVTQMFISAAEHQFIPVLPGWAVQVVDGGLNQAFNVSYRWRERGLEESERS